MNIRSWTMNDYLVCKEIADAFSESTPTEEVFSELVKNTQIFVATEENRILWFISYKLLWNESIFLQFLRIHKDHHRRWIASRLIKHIEDLRRNKWDYEIFSTVLEDNVPSKILHESLWYTHSWEINFDSGKELVYLKVL